MQFKQPGFTLVELVVVVVIIGLLAVAALPQFSDVADKARKASVEGISGGFSTGVIAARAQWEAKGRPSIKVGGESYNSVDYDGVNFWLTRSKDSSGASTGYRDGYPWAVNREGARFPTQLTDEACIDLMSNLLQNPPQVGSVSDANIDPNVRYSAQADSATSSCIYVQQEGGLVNQFVYYVQTGQVMVTAQ